MKVARNISFLSKFICLAVTVIASLCVNATELTDFALLPEPQQAEFGNRKITLKSCDLEMPEWKQQWDSTLASYGIIIAKTSRFKINGKIVDSIKGAPVDNDEAYVLDISKNGINVEATSEKGIYWALQTLAQLLAAGSDRVARLPECRITDWPAFPVRGFMMDVGRSYISMDELKREISTMSQFKLNTFHWHLTENQAWRLESKIFPMLNDSSNMERHPGKYYTLDQARELVDYAKAHNITVIPEIDMPGHSEAFVRTFRHDMQSPEGMKILKLLVEEVCETFDVPYLHIGTDEVNFTNPDFVPEMVNFVKSKGKKIISWHPGWNYKPGEIDMTFMWSYRGQPTPGIPAVDLRFHYINHFDTYADLVALFRSKVYNREQSDKDIAGVEIALWNDRFVEDEASMIAQNSVYPAMLAVAERSWRGGGTEYFDTLGTNLKPEHTADFNQFADFERRLLWHKDNTLDSIHIPYVRQTNVTWRITDPFPNNGDLTAVFPPETEGLRETYTFNDSVFTTRQATGSGIYLRHVWGNLIPAFYSNPQPDHTAYAYTYVYAPCSMNVGAQIETQNYSRSESDIPPPAGQWDYRNSKIWINGHEVQAPDWTSNHSERSNEISLGNENFAARPVIPVKLDKGWNSVLIKLPVGQFNTPETRLVKWMFTFVFTTPDGRKAAPGLIYSPEKIK